MTDNEHDKFEAGLRRLKPANSPSLIARLLAGKPRVKTCSIELPRPATPTPGFAWLLRWLIPAAAVLILGALISRDGLAPAHRQATPAASPEVSAMSDLPVLQADDVRIGQELVSSFDAVARLPGGEPVRFRFEQWVDQMVLSNTAHGLVVESRTPRFEVVPVGFETY